MERFWHRLSVAPHTLVLDVGGTPYNWKLVPSRPRLVMTNITLMDYAGREPGASWVVADARRLPFKDQSIDVLFCNSVIEHVETFENQRLMANEWRRVGRRYWVQTPNREFPVEPHLMTPFIHWLPRKVQRRLLRNFTLWGLWSRPTEERCDRFMREVRLVDPVEMRQLFPEAEIWHERMLGMSKSLVAIK
jgi:Methyltransferase domain